MFQGLPLEGAQNICCLSRWG